MSAKIYLVGHRELSDISSPGTWRKEWHKSRIDYYKIGIAENPKKRLSSLKSGTPHDLELVTTIESSDAKSVESTLHRIYQFTNRKGEWFTLVPNDVNSLIGLDRLEPCDVKPLNTGIIPEWIGEQTSLYVEVHRARKGEYDESTEPVSPEVVR